MRERFYPDDEYSASKWPDAEFWVTGRQQQYNLADDMTTVRERVEIVLPSGETVTIRRFWTEWGDRSTVPDSRRWGFNCSGEAVYR